MFVYSLLMAAVLVLGSPYWLWRMATSGRYRAGLGQRLGGVPQHLRTAASGRPVLWVHAVSVGEVLAGLRLISELETVRPDLLIILSTTTQTGQELATRRLGADRVFYFPLDFKFTVSRYLDKLRPRLLVLMESELWPRMLAECERRHIPVAVVNGRVSDRSLPRYLLLKSLWRPLLAKVMLLLAQDEDHADRWIQIGAPAQRVHATGNLKYDVRGNSQTAMTTRVQSLLPQNRLIVAGSTLQGEEEALLAMWPAIVASVPDAVLLIAPRHPQRFEQVSELIQKSGYPFFRCSQLMAATEPIFPGTILLLDTIGDLASMYALGSVAFVGGSLVSAGGHNPLEPAQFGVPTVIGSSFENFRDIVAKMRDSDGLRIVASDIALQTTLMELLLDPDAAQAMGLRGQAVYEAQAGATSRTVRHLLPLLKAATT